nr:helix-turn-helix domain-containing protein [Deinococcus sp. 6YEL10]
MNVLFVHSALDDYPLTPEEFRVYAHLARRAGRGDAYPAVGSMARQCRMHEDTVRRCLHNLMAFKMIEKYERKGRTTLYTLTKFSKWVRPEIVTALHAQQSQVGAAKRAAKKAAKAQPEEASAPNPPETKGGVQEEAGNQTPPKRGEGYPPVTEGGDPSETKGGEGNPLNLSPEGSVSNVVEDARGDRPEETQAAPVVELTDAPHTTGFEKEEQLLEAVREQPAGVEQQSPDGEAADAAPTDTELTLLFGDSEGVQETQEVTAMEDVPRAAPPAVLGTPASRVDDLMPVPELELFARPAALPTEATYRLVKGMVGGNKAIDDGILETLTPAGAISRQHWLRLTEEELTEVRSVAQAEAKANSLNFYTVAIRGLDRMIGAPIGQTTTRSAGGGYAPSNIAGLAPARHAEPTDYSADQGKYDIGAQWTGKKDRTIVTIQGTEIVKRRNTEGLVYHLSNGRTCNALQLMTEYEFTPTPQQAAS